MVHSPASGITNRIKSNDGITGVSANGMQVAYGVEVRTPKNEGGVFCGCGHNPCTCIRRKSHSYSPSHCASLNMIFK